MLKRICWIAFALLIVFTVWLRVNDKGLPKDLPYRSQALQYECDTQCAKLIVAGYGDKVDVARRGVYIDYGFLIAYGLFFAAACLLAARGAGWFWKLGYLLAAGAIAAAVLDAIENIGVLQQLAGNYGWTGVTCMLSKIKIALLTIITVFLLIRAAWLHWPTAKRLYVFLLPLRFTGLLLLVIAFAFLLSDQGYDVIANIAEDDPEKIRPSHQGQRIGFVFSMILLALQAWYWSRHLLRVPEDEGGAPADEFPGLAQWLPRIAGVLAFVIGIGSLFRVFTEYQPGSPVRREIIHMLIYLVIALALFVGFVIVRRKTMLKGEAHGKQHGWREIKPITWFFLGGSTIVSLALFVLSTFRPQSTVFFGSAVIVTLSFALAMPIGSLLVYFGMRWKFPVLTLLLVWAVIISPFADNHKVRSLAPIPATAQRDDIQTTYTKWLTRLKERPAPNGRYPVFIVATEGGGIRAAYWTASVLTTLTDEVPEFADHLFAISGVSGGSVGAAVYEGLLVKRLENYTLHETKTDSAPAQDTPQALLRDSAREILSHDVLAPVLASMTQPDLAQRFVPWPIFPDRAQALEQGWERAWRDSIKRPDKTADELFSSGFLATVNTRDHLLPSLFLNGTIVETGQRITTSNCRTSEEVLDSVDFLDLLGRDIRMSTAAHNSARFTYVSPAGTVVPECTTGIHAAKINCTPGKSCGHIVDGGYFENSGAATALDILRVIAELKDPQVDPYVIFIKYTDLSQKASVATYANEALSPVRALLAVRGARGELAVQDLKKRAKSFDFELRKVEGVTFPLGWLLADHTRTLMDAQMSDKDPVNYPRVQEIKRLLGK
jgi:hypothetical protein